MLLLLVYSASITTSNAQSLKGVLRDENEKLPIIGATVKLTDTANNPSTVVTDKLGAFNYPNISTGTYTLSISSIGYDPYEKVISFKDSGNVDMGIISVPKSAKILSTVTVNATAPPVKQKADTLEYSANAYKINPDANAEDLIKKMPGN